MKRRMNTNTRKLHDLGQRIWLDNITREMLNCGPLARCIAEVQPQLNKRLGVAIAMRACKADCDLLGSEQRQGLAAAGARPQRLLWASTGTKNPAAPDTIKHHAALADKFGGPVGRRVEAAATSRRRNWRPSRHSRSALPNRQVNESRASSTAPRATQSLSTASRATPPAAGSPRGPPASKTSARFTPRALWARYTCSAACMRRRPASMQ